jgi:fructose-bisphosphate aldolase class II
MPVADYPTYCRMIDNALDRKFAYPAINVTSLTTVNGVLRVWPKAKATGSSRFRRVVGPLPPAPR